MCAFLNNVPVGVFQIRVPWRWCLCRTWGETWSNESAMIDLRLFWYTKWISTRPLKYMLVFDQKNGLTYGSNPKSFTCVNKDKYGDCWFVTQCCHGGVSGWGWCTFQVLTKLIPTEEALIGQQVKQKVTSHTGRQLKETGSPKGKGSDRGGANARCGLCKSQANNLYPLITLRWNMETRCRDQTRCNLKATGL